MIIASASLFSFPAVDGLHFPEHCFYPIMEEVDGRFVAGRSPIQKAALDADVATLYPDFESPAEDDAHLIVGGGGAWEGEGFLALVHRDSREAVWVLYLETAEAFVSAYVSEDTVYAVSSEYPFSTQWSIRACHPPEVLGVRTHAP